MIVGSAERGAIRLDAAAGNIERDCVYDAGAGIRVQNRLSQRARASVGCTCDGKNRHGSRHRRPRLRIPEGRGKYRLLHRCWSAKQTYYSKNRENGQLKKQSGIELYRCEIFFEVSHCR